MNVIRRCLFIVLSVIVGAVFLYSAYTKLSPIQRFEYTIVEYIHIPWLLAAITARFLIGLEAALGALLIFNLYGNKKWVLKTALSLLLLFSAYIIYLWIKAGNNVNCGCFGDNIWMSPSSSLIKNAGLIMVVGLLLRYYNGLHFKRSNLVSISLLLLSFVLTYSIYYIPGQKPNWLRNDKYKMDFSVLYSNGKTDIPATDLNKGKYIIAFLSQSCAHCRLTAYKMHLMKQQDPSLPFFMIIGGTSDLTDFFEYTKAQNIPYTRLDKDNFLKYTGNQFPLIVMVNNGWVEAKTDYVTMDQAAIEQWLNNRSSTPGN